MRKVGYNGLRGRLSIRKLILEIRQVYKLPGHVLFPCRLPMRFQIFNLATAEMAQLFCKAGGESFAVSKHIIGQHMHDEGPLDVAVPEDEIQIAERRRMRGRRRRRTENKNEK